MPGMSSGRATATARIFAPACETTWPMSYRSSIFGLTISTRCPAISARRRRRMSSSLLPLNIGPHTTSNQPPAFGKLLITEGSLRRRPDGLLRLLELVLGETPEARDAHEAALLVHDGEMAEVLLEHHLRGVLDLRVGLDGDDTLRHPLAHLRLGRSRALRDRAENVTLGDDPDDARHVLHDDDRPDAGLDHLLGRLADRRRRVNRDDALVHDFGNGGHDRSLTKRAAEERLCVHLAVLNESEPSGEREGAPVLGVDEQRRHLVVGVSRKVL